jgi:[ribosomal protein S18]-alanine N-acetyltransferase
VSWSKPEQRLTDSRYELSGALSSIPGRLRAGVLRVRAGLTDDLRAIAALEADAYPFPWTMGNFADSMASDYDFWIVEAATVPAAASMPEILAYCVVMWLPDEAHILNITVASQLQKRGLGRRFLSWVLEDAKARGAHSMMLEVRPSNVVALSLYTSMDFTQIGLRKSYYASWNNSREDAIVMSKPLSIEEPLALTTRPEAS